MSLERVAEEVKEMLVFLIFDSPKVDSAMLLTAYTSESLIFS